MVLSDCPRGPPNTTRSEPQPRFDGAQWRSSAFAFTRLGLAQNPQARGIFELVLDDEEVGIRNHGKLRFAVLVEDLGAKPRHV